MTRPVVHLVQAPSFRGSVHEQHNAACDSAVPACAHACALTPEFDHRVLLLADSEAGRWATEAGLPVACRLNPPAGRVRAIRRVIRSTLSAWLEPNARTHLWNEGLASVVPESLSPSVVAPLAIPWSPLHALRDRAGLRDRLGLAPRTRAVAVLQADTAFGVTFPFVFAMGLAELAAAPAAAIVPRWAADTRRAVTFYRTARRGFPLVLADRPWTSALLAADVVVRLARPNETQAERTLAHVLRRSGVHVVPVQPEALTSLRKFGPVIDAIKGSATPPAPERAPFDDPESACDLFRSLWLNERPPTPAGASSSEALSPKATA
ncbi:MAG: hypothetical protein AAF138_08670 [Planctomycetota bacterium]